MRALAQASQTEPFSLPPLPPAGQQLLLPPYWTTPEDKVVLTSENQRIHRVGKVNRKSHVLISVDTEKA